jgi:hypothetical protein
MPLSTHWPAVFISPCPCPCHYAPCQANTDISAPAGFKLTHGRPGTVSLSISAENDEDPAIKERSSYRCGDGGETVLVWGVACRPATAAHPACSHPLLFPAPVP